MIIKNALTISHISLKVKHYLSLSNKVIKFTEFKGHTSHDTVGTSLRSKAIFPYLNILHWVCIYKLLSLHCDFLSIKLESGLQRVIIKCSIKEWMLNWRWSLILHFFVSVVMASLGGYSENICVYLICYFNTVSNSWEAEKHAFIRHSQGIAIVNFQFEHFCFPLKKRRRRRPWKAQDFQRFLNEESGILHLLSLTPEGEGHTCWTLLPLHKDDSDCQEFMFLPIPPSWHLHFNKVLPHFSSVLLRVQSLGLWDPENLSEGLQSRNSFHNNSQLLFAIFTKLTFVLTVQCWL